MGWQVQEGCPHTPLSSWVCIWRAESRAVPMLQPWPPSSGDTFLGSCFRCQAERQGDWPEATPTSLGPASSLGGAATLTLDGGHGAASSRQDSASAHFPELESGAHVPLLSWLWGSRQDPELVWASVSWCMKRGETDLLCPPQAVLEAGWCHVTRVDPWRPFTRRGMPALSCVTDCRGKGQS